MPANDKIVLVIGASGNQGSAVVRALLRKGWRVRGLTRNLDKQEVQVLQNSGVEMVIGNMDNLTSLEEAMKGVYGVFSIQSLFKPGIGWMGDGFAGEVRQGKAVADAAKKMGIQHLVYSSVGGAERDSGLPHFECKWQIEQYIREIGLPATIIRPTVLMEMLNVSRNMIISGDLPSFGLYPDKTIQLIATEDLGELVSIVFENPQQYIGQALEIAGDELTEGQMAAIFNKVTGQTVKATTQPISSGQKGAVEEGRTDTWFNTGGFIADIDALRIIYPELMDLETWLRKEGWETVVL